MKKVILLLGLVLVVFLSGCDEQQTEELPYKNDILTIEEYFVSDRKPYETSIVMIELLLKNNGEESITWAKVGFKAPGFEIDDLSCEGSSGKIEGDECYCIFDSSHAFGEIESLENAGERRVILALKTDDKDLMHPYPLTVTYTIEYNYSGFRKMDIPIIDGITLTKPLSEYSQSSATYGPILIKFESPERGERIEDGQTIKEYWGVRNTPFNVRMKFTHIGSGSIGEIKDPKIEAGMVKLDLRGSLEIATVDSTELPCDFYKKGEYYISNDRKDKPPLKEVKIPGELMCNFQSTVFTEDYTEPETTASIWVEYNYTYSYTNSQEIEVQPLP